MRTFVSQCLIGTAALNTAGTLVALTAVPNGSIIAFDWATKADILSTTTEIGFAKGTADLAKPIITGPFAKEGIVSFILNPYEAAVKQKITLKVDTAPAEGESVLVKIAYNDNLSIIPNQIKQTIISVLTPASADANSVAAAIAAEFNKQEFLFANVTVTTDTVTFEAITLTTASAYNGIDRPENVVFSVGISNENGAYTVTQTVAPKFGQGDAAKMAWLEDQHMGRLGYSDRRSWNAKKYVSQVYATLVLSANRVSEGDMQDTRSNPVGVIIGGDGATVAHILTSLAVASIAPETVAAS